MSKNRPRPKHRFTDDLFDALGDIADNFADTILDGIEGLVHGPINPSAAKLQDRPKTSPQPYKAPAPAKPAPVMPNYYDILGVAPNDTHETIQSVYRSLSQIYHPDKTKTSSGEEKFKAISTAWRVLGNRDRRAEYDKKLGLKK